MKPDETKSRGHGDKRSRKVDQLISALLSHPSLEAAADASGVSRITAWRWLKDPAVLTRLREARREAMNRAIARLQEAATEAVDCLCEVQRDGESESARVSASRCILEQALRATELGDVQERLARLEALTKNRWKGTTDDEPNSAPAAKAGGANGRG
jgi:hypothetical protein